MRTTDIADTRHNQGRHRRLITLTGSVALAGALFLSPTLLPQASAAEAHSAPVQPASYSATWPKPPGSYDYRLGYRNGYRDGSRDGWAEGKLDCKREHRYQSRIQSTPDSEYDRGYTEGYNQGFELGFDRAVERFCR